MCPLGLFRLPVVHVSCEKIGVAEGKRCVAVEDHMPHGFKYARFRTKGGGTSCLPISRGCNCSAILLVGVSLFICGGLVVSAYRLLIKLGEGVLQILWA
jgi:hypothetical protein